MLPRWNRILPAWAGLLALFPMAPAVADETQTKQDFIVNYHRVRCVQAPCPPMRVTTRAFDFEGEIVVRYDPVEDRYGVTAGDDAPVSVARVVLHDDTRYRTRSLAEADIGDGARFEGHLWIDEEADRAEILAESMEDAD